MFEFLIQKCHNNKSISAEILLDLYSFFLKKSYYLKSKKELLSLNFVTIETVST